MGTQAPASKAPPQNRATGDKVILFVLALFSLIVGVLVVLVYYLGAGMNAQMRMLPQMKPVALNAPSATSGVPEKAAVPVAKKRQAPQSNVVKRPDGSVLVKRRNPAAMPDGPTKKSTDRFVIPLDSFVVSMGGAGSHFLKLSLSVEVGTQETQTEIESKKAEIRTALVSHFSGISPDATKGVAGKKKLTVEAGEQIESVLKSGTVNRVYISEIVSR